MGNIDWDAAWQAAAPLFYGPGTRMLITILLSIVFIEGALGHRWSHCLMGVIGALGYFGSGMLMGRFGIH